MANSPIRTTSRLGQSIHTSIYSADDIFIDYILKLYNAADALAVIYDASFDWGL